MDSSPGRPSFGPPANPLAAFGWSALQVPRALVWQLRERELRALTVTPLGWTALLGALGLVGAALASGPLTDLLVDHGGPLHFAARAGVTVVLLLLVCLAVWQLQSAIAAPSLERMALYVQRQVEGDAPPADAGLASALKKAVTGLVPSVKKLLAWALTAALGFTLILVPVVGAALVVVAQATVAALFLAHGAITENRSRLGLPRRLLLREPALVLGLAAGCAPFVLVPPLLLVGGGTLQVAGALVALGCHRRRATDPSA